MSLQNQFKKFNENIRLSATKLDELREKRNKILDKLRANEDLPSFEEFGQGSYRMGTEVKPIDKDYDIDVGLRFNVNKNDYEAPLTLKKQIRDILKNHTEYGAEIKTPCVTVTYKKDGETAYHVDIVTYTYEETTHTNEQLLLTNEELLMLIKAKIIQNYCEGTLQQMNAYYATTGLNIYVNTSESPATANLYLVYYEEQELSNIDKLFLAEQLIIRSMGIKYNTQILIPSTVLIWDQINATNTNGWADNTYIHNINLILQNLATSVNANISITNANANKFTVTDCLLAIESIGGDEGINATGTCIDGFGHRGPISKLQYTSATNTLNITFTDETTGEGTFHWPLSGRYPPTTETINDNVTNMSHEGGNWVI